MKIILLILMQLILSQDKNKKVKMEHELDLLKALQEHHQMFKYVPKGGKLNHFVISLSKTEVFEQGLCIVLTSNNPTMSIDVVNTLPKGQRIEGISQDGNLILVIDKDSLQNKLGVKSKQETLMIQVKNQIGKNDVDFQLSFFYPKEAIELQINIEYFLNTFQKETNLQLQYKYQGEAQIDTLRFQQYFFKDSEDSFYSAQLIDQKQQRFICNKIFRNILAGVLQSQQGTVCQDKSCVYQVNLDMKNQQLSKLMFQVQMKEQLILLFKNLFLYDKIYTGDQQRQYMIQANSESLENGFVVTVNDISGTADLYLSPSVRPNDLSHYIWKGQGSHSKKITVTKDELDQLQFNGNTFYLTVNSSNPGEFLIRTQINDQQQTFELTQGQMESGHVTKKKSQKFYIQSLYQKTEDFTFNINFSSSQKVDLSFVSCYDFTNCQETQISQEQKISLDQLNHQAQIQTTFQCQAHVELEINVCYLLFELSTDQEGLQEFHLMVTENITHSLLTLGKVVKVELEEEQIQNFKIVNTNPGNENFALYIESIWGIANIVITAMNQINPQGSTQKQLLVGEMESTVAKHTTLVNLNEDEFMKGQWQELVINCQGKTNSGISLRFIKEDFSNKGNSHLLHKGDTFKDILIGTHSENKYQLSSLQPNSAENCIHLIPIHGSFEMIIQAKNRGVIKRAQNNVICFEVGQGEENQYELIVRLNRALGSEQEQAWYQVIFQDDLKTIPLRKQIVQPLDLDEDQKGLIEIDSNSNSLFVILTQTEDKDINICIRTQDYIKDDKPCIGVITYQQKGVQFDKGLLSDLCQNQTKSCKFYLETTHKPISNTTIAFTVNNHPIWISLENLIQGPIANFPIKFLITISNKEPIRVHFTDNNDYQQIAATLIKNTQNLDQYEQAFNSLLEQKENNSKLTFEKEDFDLGENTMDLAILIKPTGKFVPSSNLTGFTLQVESKIRSIPSNQSIEAIQQENQIYYYRIFVPSEHQQFFFTVISSLHSFLQVFISREFLSNPEHNPEKVFISQESSSLVNIKFDMAKNYLDASKSIEEGYYIIGVKSDQTEKLVLLYGQKEEKQLETIGLNRIYQSFLQSQIEKVYWVFIPKNKQKLSQLQIQINCQNVVQVKVWGEKRKNNQVVRMFEDDTKLKNKIHSMLFDIDKQSGLEGSYVNISFLSKETSKITLQIQRVFSGSVLGINPGQTLLYNLENGQSQDYQINHLKGHHFQVILDKFFGESQIELIRKDYDKNEKVLLINKMSELDHIKGISDEIPKDSEMILRIRSMGSQSLQGKLTLQIQSQNHELIKGNKQGFQLTPGASQKFEFYKRKKQTKLFFSMKILKIQDAFKFAKDFKHIQTMIKVYGEDSKGNPKEIKKEIVYFDKFMVEFVVNLEKNFSRHLLVEVQNPIDSYIQGKILIGTKNSMELVSEEVGVIRTDFEVNKFLVRGPSGSTLDLYLNVCHGSINLNANDIKLDNFAGEKYFQLKIDETQKTLIKVTQNKSSQNIHSMYQIKPSLQSENDKRIIIKDYNSRRLKIDLENRRISFINPEFQSHLPLDFKYLVKIRLIFAQEQQSLTYLKYCGNYGYEEIYPKSKHKIYEQEIWFESTEALQAYKGQQSTYSLGELEKKRVYFASLDVHIEAYSSDNEVQPLRNQTTTLVKFSFQTFKSEMNWFSIVTIVILLGLFIFAYQFISSYVSGSIGDLDKYKFRSQLEQLKRNVFGFKVFNLLENDYEPVRREERPNEGEFSLPLQ